MANSEEVKKHVALIIENPRMITSISLTSIVLDVLEVLQRRIGNDLSFPQFLICISKVVKASMINIWDIQRFLKRDEISHLLQTLSLEIMSPELIQALRILYQTCPASFSYRNDHLLFTALCSNLSDPFLKYQSYQLLCESLQLPSAYCSTLLSSKGLLPYVFTDLIDVTTASSHFVESLKLNSTIPQILFKPNHTQTVSIDGLIIPTIRSEQSSWRSPHLIQTPSSISNLRRIAQSVSLNIPIILQGESGSGKSFYIRELAALMGFQDSILELHLDEQTDNKSLIGSYICSDVPGEFIWQPGLITQAVRNGHWLIIEDIDKASLDVIATITPILEMGKIVNGIQGEILVHPNFRIFGTCTTQIDSNQKFPTIPSLRHFNSFWHIINLTPPSIQEIELILSQSHLYSQLHPVILDYLLSTFKWINFDSNNSHNSHNSHSSHSGHSGSSQLHSKKLFSRSLTLRDLFKSANRMSSNHRLLRKNLSVGVIDSNYVTEQQRIESLCEIVDVFLASARKKDESFHNFIYQIATKWGLSEDIITTEILQRHPTLVIQGNIIRIGRNELIKPSSNLIEMESSHLNSFTQSFAFSKSSLRLLEAVSGCVAQNEPILLVGETGCGKTTVIQELANLMSHKLVVQNMSLSTDSSDLLGGFRPVSLKQLFQPTYEQFVILFRLTFSQTQNSDYLQAVSQFYHKEQWKKLLKSFEKASTNALTKLTSTQSTEITLKLIQDWNEYKITIKRLECNLSKILNGFAFAFVDGLIVEAMKKGYWVLLDEINLASSETLQGLIGILDGQSLCLTEKGDILPIQRHSNFRIFAAMNPPTDVGKRELPSSLRTRFTEIFVEEMLDRHDLQDVVNRYLQVNGDNMENSNNDAVITSSKTVGPITDAVDVYLGCRASADHSLTDGAGQKPHYSLRSLTRALKACNTFLELGFRPLSRALYEGFTVSFQTQLDDKSRKFMETFLAQSLRIKDMKSLQLPSSRPGGRKSTAKDWILIKPYWIRAGPLPPVDWSLPDSNGIIKFVMTPSVENNIRDLARAVSANVTSVLLQGPTSVGKTTMIEYLAARCGYRCIRINNHEHTDVQEYIGGYITGSNGNLYFRDGVLVEALRRGDWIILDELNLAPSDVLEALNRLLDDNRELYVPETGEFIKPSPGFFLFATQNPAGIYGGRKPLSRAFRNRFIENFIGDIPYKEIEDIVSSTCGIPLKYSKILVSVMKEMHLRRQQSTLLQGKSGSITTRDLIKWGKRIPHSPLDIIRDGYMILAERHRNNEEKEEILQILLKICKIDSFSVEELYSIDLIPRNDNEQEKEDEERVGVGSHELRPLENQKKRQKITSQLLQPEKLSFKESAESLKKIQQLLRDKQIHVEGVTGLALTNSMKRLWTLVHRCAKYSEPALIIGETGCGKTTVCQLLAAVNNQQIRIVNCHQSTETADIIGGLRPVRGRVLLLKSLLQEIEEILLIDYALHLPCCNKLPRLSSLGDDINFDESLLVSAMQELSTRFPSTDNVDVTRESLKRTTLESTPSSTSTATSTSSTTQSLAISKCKICLELWLRYQSLFEWQDGPLVTAMRNGDVFVLDEINLAEDAVIERLNSVLESSRTITLAEKGGDDVFIVAHPNFRFYATMNPGDDYGKRELSPALRSRFSEIWVSGVNSNEDLILIITEMLPNLTMIPEINATTIASLMVEYMNWINLESKTNTLIGIKVSVREVLAWAKFIVNWNCVTALDVYIAFVHGVQMLILDGLGIGLPISRIQVSKLKIAGLQKALSLCPENWRLSVSKTVISPELNLNQSENHNISISESIFSVGFFSIPMGSYSEISRLSNRYVLQAESTILNFQRVLRAMKLPRPILLEGPPGVGKTSLISNLARLSGHKLIRINLSEHSEISDLIGSDLPTGKSNNGNDDETDNGAKFKWCDGVFLNALKNGDWVLLDELNLAPQSVLEGLNACFDHRGEVFISELGKTISCPSSFRVFCAQNPMAEGGGRKGLPQSFLTRFSRVYIEQMTTEDMIKITLNAYSEKLPSLLQSYVPSLVNFVQVIHEEIVNKLSYGRLGSPWEFNLRDIFRWCDLLSSRLESFQTNFETFFIDQFQPIRYMIADTAYSLFVARLRTPEDRNQLKITFQQIFQFPLEVNLTPRVDFLPTNPKIIIGSEILDYNYQGLRLSPRFYPLTLRSAQLNESNHSIRGDLQKPLEILAGCVNHHWPVLLVGQAGSGKRRIIRQLARLTGNYSSLVEYSVSPSTDSTELLGSFEQANIYRNLLLAMKLFDHICAQLFFIYLSKNTEHFHHFNQNLSQIFSIHSPLSKYIYEIIEKNEIILHCGLPNSIDNIFQDLNTLLGLLQETIQNLQQTLSSLSLHTINFEETFHMITQINELLLECYNRATNTEVSGMFEWVDGVVVEALENGYWLLVNNVNLCSASVLDRLNSLLETDGTLLLTESGSGRIVTPHPNFRIFFTMDITYGEISRAMRNRCVEISLNGHEIVGFEQNEIKEKTTFANNPQLSRDIASLYIQNTINATYGQDTWNSMMRLYHELLSYSQHHLSPYFPVHKLFVRGLKFIESELHNGSSLIHSLQSLTQNIFPMINSNSLLPVNNPNPHISRNNKNNENENNDNNEQFYFNISSLNNLFEYLPSDLCSSLICYFIVHYLDVIDLDQKDDWIVGMFLSNQDRLLNLFPDIMQSNFHSFHNLIIKDENKRVKLLELWKCNTGKWNCDEIRPYAAALIARNLVYATTDQKLIVKNIFSQFSNLLGKDDFQFFDEFYLNQQQFLNDHLASLIDDNNNDNNKNNSQDSLNYDQIYLSGVTTRNTQAIFAFYKLFSNSLSSQLLKTILLLTNWREKLIFSRFWIQCLEKESWTRVNSLQYGQVDHEEDWSLFEISIMIHKKFSMFNDSAEGKVLGSLLHLLQHIDQLFEFFTHWITQLYQTNQTNHEPILEIHQIVEVLMTNLEQLYTKRDILSHLLLTTKSILRKVSWDKIILAGQWIKTEFLSLFTQISEIQLVSIHSNVLMKSFRDMKLLITQCENSYISLWNKSFSLDNSHLWSEGGHSATPIKLSDWNIREQILTVVGKWIGSLLIPSYVDTWCQPLGLLPNNIPYLIDENSMESSIMTFYSLRTSHKLISDWIGVLCTFYWSNTNEISLSAQKVRSTHVQVDFKSLLEQLQSIRLKSIDHISSLMGINFEIELSSPNEDNISTECSLPNSLPPVSQCSRRIDFELSQNGSLFAFALSEQDILRTFFHISNLLGQINYTLLFTNHNLELLSTTLLSQLLNELKLLLTQGLFHSTFNPLLFREIQTLIWFLESLQISSNCFNLTNLDDYSVLKQLCNRFSIMFDLRLYTMVTRNLSNSFKCLSFHYDSRTLMRFVNNPYYAEDHDEGMIEITSLKNNFELYELRMNGPIRLLQSSTIEFVLRLLNLHTIKLPLTTSKILFKQVKFDESRLTVSTYQEVKQKISQLFHQITYNSCEFGKFSSSETLTRLDLMSYYIIILIQSIRDYLDSQVYQQFLTLINLHKVVSIQKLFQQIINLNLSSHCQNHSVTKLLTQCLHPILQVLSSEEIAANIQNNFMEIQYAWVCLGILRFMFSLPSSPVDPALTAAHQSLLLSTCSSRIKNQLKLEKVDSSIRGDGLVLPLHGNLEEHFIELEMKISSLKEQAIERPVDSPLFNELFQDIHDLSENILSSDRIFTMITDCLNRYNSIKSVVDSSHLKSSAVEAHLSQLMDYSQNEIMWQSTLDNFIIRLQTIFKNYEDIISPIISALQNISFGVRQIVSYTLSYFEEYDMTKNQNSLQQLEDSTQLLFSLPCTIRFPLSSSSSLEKLNHLVLRSVNDIPSSIQILSDRTTRRLGSLGDGNLSTIFSKSLILSKIDFLLSSQLSQSSLLYPIFSDCIHYFIASYRGIVETKAKLELKKSSLYHYRDESASAASTSVEKSSNQTFESNDEKEELIAIRANFPDHLADFQDILNPTDHLNQNENQNHNNNQSEKMLIENNEDQLAGDDVMTEEMIDMLINSHSRMLLLYLPHELKSQRMLWNLLSSSSFSSSSSSSSSSATTKTKAKTTSRGKQSSHKNQKINISFTPTLFYFDQQEFTELSSFTRDQLSKYSTVVAKAFEQGLSYIPSTKIDSLMRGFSLSILGSLTKESQIYLTNSDDSWSVCLLRQHEQKGSSIDRDLLYLLDATVGTAWNPYNIHLHSNSREILLTGPPLRKMLQDAVDLLVIFPGNDFLLTICKISSRIAQFSINEPVGRMLQSLQLLLKASQEWEQYAAKHVSLSESIKSITNLISRWRTLELKSWTSLLRGREIIYVQRARKFWFTLYNALNTLPDSVVNEMKGKNHSKISLFVGWKIDEMKSIDGLITWLFTDRAGEVDVGVEGGNEKKKSTITQHYNKLTESVHQLKSKSKQKKKSQMIEDEEINGPQFDEQKYLLDIFDSLDGFLRACVVGEFPVRLHLLRLFCLEKFQVYVLQNQQDDATVDYYRLLHLKIASICYGVWCYYSQFLPVIRKFQEMLKTPLQNRLNDEIKISKWDELNVYAVVEHSEKVHRKLTKIIREYEVDVLDYPVTAVLQREIMSSLISEQGELKAATEIPAIETMYPYTDRPTFQIQKISTNNNEESSVPVEGEDDERKDDEGEGEGVGDEDEDEDKEKEKEVTKEVVEIVEIIPLDYIEPEDNSTTIIAQYSQQIEVPSTNSQLASLLSQHNTASIQRLVQTPKLYLKMKQYLVDLLELPSGSSSSPSSLMESDDQNNNNSLFRYHHKVRYGLMAAEISENLCSDIFYRIEVLRSQAIEKSNRNVKHRALADLFHRLKEEGISHLRSYSPSQSKSSVDIFSIPSITPVEYTSHLSHSIFGDKLNLLDKGENYFYRNVCEMNQLRAQALSPYSPDVSSREVQVMLGQTESLFFNLLRSRSFLSEGLKSISHLLNLSSTLKSFIQDEPINQTNNSVVINQQKMREIWKYNNQAGKILKCSILEMKEMFLTTVDCSKDHPVDIWSTNTGNSREISKWKIELIESNIDQVLHSLDKVIDFSSLHPLNDRTTNPLTPTLPLALQPTELTFTFNILQTYSQSLELLKVSLKEFSGVSSSYLSEILSPDVVTPLQTQLVEFMSLLSDHREYFDSLTSLSDDVVGDVDNVGNSSDNFEKYLKPLSLVIDDCLITIQNLRSFSNDTTLLTSANHKKGYFNEDILLPVLNSESESHGSFTVIPLISCLSIALKSFSTQKIPFITNCLSNILNEMNSEMSGNCFNQCQISILLKAVLPLVDNVVASCVVLIEDLLQAYKSLGKLLYICLRTFRVLLAKGFCSDQTKDGGEGDGESNDISKMVFEDDVEGTGMGEGEGKKDVSDQIENEEQLLGTKNENENKEQEKPNKQLNEEEKETGVEMMQDFEGDMCDLPEDQKNDDDESESNEEEEKEDLEREMGGDLDYENIVDEKQWDDDESDDGNEKNEDEEKFENESKMKGETIDGEMTTNDEKNEEDSSNDKKEEEEKEGNQDSKKGDKGDDDKDEGSEEDGDHQNDESKIRDDNDDMEKPVGVDVKEDKSNQEESGENEADEEGEEEDGMGGEPKETEEQEQDDDQAFPEDMELEGGGSGDEDDIDENPENETKVPDDGDDDDNDNADDNDNDKEDEDDKMNEEKGEEDEEENQASAGGNNNSESQNEQPDLPEEEEEKEAQKLDLNVPEQKKKTNSANIGLKSQNGTDSVLESGEIIEDEMEQSHPEEESQETKKTKNSSSGSSTSDGAKAKPDDNTDPDERDSKGGAQSGKESSKGQQSEGESQEKEQNRSDRRKMEPPNPFRKLGDINKRWEKRLNMDTSQDEEEEPQDFSNQNNNENQKSSSYQFELNDKNDDPEKDEGGGTQVLAEANEKDAVHLHEKSEEQQDDDQTQGQQDEGNGAEGDEDGGSEDENNISMDKSKREKKRDRSHETNEEGDDSNSASDPTEQQKSKKSKHIDNSNDEDGENIPSDFDDSEPVDESTSKLPKEDEKSGGILIDNLDSWNPRKDNESNTGPPSHPNDKSTTEEDDFLDDDKDAHELEVVVNDISNLDEKRLRKGHEQWAQLTALYQGPCIRLTEQLRLVLEPTLASRLQGDYRTGKRISMRRVIGYVASGFRKDKIWLRRTKPYKREYQIMVMIDDSRSMGEAGPVALAALNVLAGALTRLEVGHVGVCSFAEKVSYLHAFHEPFNESTGSRILSQFQFTSSQTRLAAALNAILPLFEESKSLSSNNAMITVQICFIISDARIDSDNREKLSSIIRELAEKHILAVLIIIDKNIDQKDSIFATKSVEFTPNGLITKSYLDDFPFPYYVAISQIDALPEVLAGALKQWFELVRSELA